MRNRETHFDQVPIEVVEEVLKKAAASARMLELEESPALVPAPEVQAVAEFPEQGESTPSKGKI